MQQNTICFDNYESSQEFNGDFSCFWAANINKKTTFLYKGKKAAQCCVGVGLGTERSRQHNDNPEPKPILVKMGELDGGRISAQHEERWTLVEEIYKSIIEINEKIIISRLTIKNAFFKSVKDSLNLNNLNILRSLTTRRDRKSIVPDI